MFILLFLKSQKDITQLDNALIAHFHVPSLFVFLLLLRMVVGEGYINTGHDVLCWPNPGLDTLFSTKQEHLPTIKTLITVLGNVIL